MLTRNVLCACGLAAGLLMNVGSAANLTEGMQVGSPELKSAGPITFAPEGILLVGDTQGAEIFAIATGDSKAGAAGQVLNVDKVDEKVAALLGAAPADVLINDMAVNPETGNVFFSVSRGRGPDAKPVILRMDSAGKLGELSLKDVRFSKASLPNAPTDKQRQDVTTDLQFTGGQVLVAGLSNEEFASKLRAIPFPFKEIGNGASIEIYHGSHGRFETRSPIRTLAVFEIDGQPNILAAYTCTPLVKFPLAELKPGVKVQGKTVAELGNRNRPLDMVVYKKDGKDYLLMANSARGVMKVDLAEVDAADPIIERVKDTAGLTFVTESELKGVEQLDRLDKDHALMLVKSEAGSYSLKTVPLP